MLFGCIEPGENVLAQRCTLAPACFDQIVKRLLNCFECALIQTLDRQR